MSDQPITGTRPMHLLVEGEAIYRGGPEGAAFYVCRCGCPVFSTMGPQHEREVTHTTPPAAQGPSTRVTRA